MEKENQKKIFADNLRYYLEINQKQQKEVAKDLGIPTATFNFWCTGETYPRINKIQQLADYFGITKSDLMEQRKNYKQSEIIDLIERNNLTEEDRDSIKNYLEFVSYKKDYELLKNPNIRKLIESTKELNADEIKKILEYIDFIKTQK